MPRIEHERTGTFHVFTSPAVEGRSVAHRDLETARSAVEPQTAALQRMMEPGTRIVVAASAAHHPLLRRSAAR